ncbi:MAG: dCTP deaminase [Candidatus Omnitrophica bacterium]|nr:dCTP deaminase [Candidatus Omnitrophota bacterium]
MMLKSDSWIIETAQNTGMIEPFEQKQIKGGISFGTSSYGYDFRLSDEFKILKPDFAGPIDPKNFPKDAFGDIKTECCIIEANSFVLGRSLEYFRIPRNILTVCFGKSSYARCGVVVNVTPFEPEWEGYATLSIVNASQRAVKVYAKEGIAQILFLESDQECRISYQDKQGKYQAQKEITLPKV